MWRDGPWLTCLIWMLLQTYRLLDLVTRSRRRAALLAERFRPLYWPAGIAFLTIATASMLASSARRFAEVPTDPSANDLISWVVNQGFAVAVAVFFLIRLDSTMRKMCGELDRIIHLLERQP